MKNIHIVMSEDYRQKPLMAFVSMNDAKRTACAIHQCDAAKSSEHIKSVPIMQDVPEKVDITDVQTLIDMTIKACETADARLAARSESGQE